MSDNLSTIWKKSLEPVPSHTTLNLVSLYDLLYDSDGSLYSVKQFDMQPYEREMARRAQIKAEKEKAEKEKAKAKTAKKSSGRKKTSVFEKAINSTANTIGREIGKKIVRGIFDTFLK